jgi:hypothetical protein
MAIESGLQGQRVLITGASGGEQNTDAHEWH